MHVCVDIEKIYNGIEITLGWFARLGARLEVREKGNFCMFTVNFLFLHVLYCF